MREAFHNFDVFIFTLGLTETWRSREDGAVYPLCPGVAGGRFDENVHEFYNFCVDEVVRDVCDFIFRLREVNKRSRVILTVSPVPLIATATAKHVLVSNTYSKSVLRVAADQITRTNSNVFCFPSYEIITGYFSRGAYFGKDCRSITEKGVAHVMRLFLRHFADVELLDDPQSLEQATDGHTIEMERLIKFNCDEEALDGA